MFRDYLIEIQVNTLTLKEINLNECSKTGKLTLKGSFFYDIEENINFDLPLTYPNTELKCELNTVKKNIDTNIKCKAQEEFKNVENIIIESRLIKKKNQELFFIQGKTFNLEAKISCSKYETIKKQIIENRKYSGIFFGLLGNLELLNKIVHFFMALTRKAKNINFKNMYNFTTDIVYSNRRNLRFLDENIASDVKVTCNLNKDLNLDLTQGYNCNSESSNIQGTPISIKIDTIYNNTKY